jgi:hypothetical protein
MCYPCPKLLLPCVRVCVQVDKCNMHYRPQVYALTHIYVIEGNESYTMEELLAILVERHEASKLQRTFTGIIPYILDY